MDVEEVRAQNLPGWSEE